MKTRRGVIANGDRVWGDENVLKLIVVMVTHLCECTKATELYPSGDLYERELCLIKVVTG